MDEHRETYAERMDDYEQFIDAKLNRLARKVPTIEAMGDRVQNMTTEDWARAATTAYRNIKYDMKHITVLNGATGLPINNATITVYENDWYAFSGANGTADFTFYTNVNGTTTEEGKFDKQEYYYFNVSAPGMVSNNSNNFWNSDNYGQIEDTYYVFPVPSTIAVNLTWSNARDFDFSVVASDYDNFYRNADRMAAPGGETYTMSALHGSEYLIAYAYFFSNEVTFGTANPTVTFSANGVVYDTVAFADIN